MTTDCVAVAYSGYWVQLGKGEVMEAGHSGEAAVLTVAAGGAQHGRGRAQVGRRTVALFAGGVLALYALYAWAIYSLISLIV